MSALKLYVFLDGEEKNLYNEIAGRGYYSDDETGLYYLNARYYNPQWRRFISPDDTVYLDPETVNGLNLYCYCNNDPVNHVDPSGCASGKYHLFGYEYRISAGWEYSPHMYVGRLGIIGISSYETHTKGRTGVFYAFSGATTDITNFFDVTYYAGVGIDLFGILGLEIQLETVGIGATVSIGGFSVSLHVNLFAATSVTFALDMDMGDNTTCTTGVSFGLNTIQTLAVVALACVGGYQLINGMQPTAFLYVL